MKMLRMPSLLHEVFGEEQSVAAILSILLFGGLLTAAVAWRFPEMTESLPVWRSGLALLLVFDICAGCIANFTRGTSNYYASRSTHRLVFIAVHVHLVLIALLLNVNLGFSLAVWGYTIGGAVVVNAYAGHRSQPFAAGLLLAGGLGIAPLLPHVQPYMLIAGMLFMLKVIFSFAVDHYGVQREG